jgi:hypothetical protein
VQSNENNNVVCKSCNGNLEKKSFEIFAFVTEIGFDLSKSSKMSVDSSVINHEGRK